LFNCAPFNKLECILSCARHTIIMIEFKSFMFASIMVTAAFTNTAICLVLITIVKTCRRYSVLLFYSKTIKFIDHHWTLINRIGLGKTSHLYGGTLWYTIAAVQHKCVIYCIWVEFCRCFLFEVRRKTSPNVSCLNNIKRFATASSGLI